MSLLRNFLQFIFPPVCVACEQYAPYFCKHCQNQIDFLYYQPSFPPLKNLIAEIHILGFFTPPLSKLIKALKYQSLYPIGPILGDLLYKHLQPPADVDCVTAVPLHDKRLQWRGYNQAKLIAQQLAHRLNKPYQPLLIRQRHTQNLASASSDEERVQLIQNAFAINPKFSEKIPGKNILLVDDVITTGTTLAACAVNLKKAGADKIFTAAVAHEG